jgi:hypothetical protein
MSRSYRIIAPVAAVAALAATFVTATGNGTTTVAFGLTEARPRRRSSRAASGFVCSSKRVRGVCR